MTCFLLCDVLDPGELGGYSSIMYKTGLKCKKKKGKLNFMKNSSVFEIKIVLYL